MITVERIFLPQKQPLISDIAGGILSIVPFAMSHMIKISKKNTLSKVMLWWSVKIVILIWRRIKLISTKKSVQWSLSSVNTVISMSLLKSSEAIQKYVNPWPASVKNAKWILSTKVMRYIWQLVKANKELLSPINTKWKTA